MILLNRIDVKTVKHVVLSTVFLLMAGISSFSYGSGKTWFVEKGKLTPLSEEPITLSVANTGTTSNIAEIFANAITIDTINSSGNCLAKKFNTFKSVDGYTGLEISPGVLLVLEGAILGTALPGSLTQPPKNFSVTFSSQGVQTIDNAFLIGDQFCVSGYSSSYSPNRASGTNPLVATGTIKYSVYVSASASLPVTIPGHWRFLKETGPVATQQFIVSGDVIEIEKSCTIYPPSPINFGTIDLSGAVNGQVLAYSNGSLTVNCSGGSSSPATIQVTGDTGRYSDTLKMNWNDSSVSTSTPAEIRGFIGTPLPAAGECNGVNNGYTNYIIFKASENQKISIGYIDSGTYTIPYSFSLCSNGIKADGDANAQAVINLTWN